MASKTPTPSAAEQTNVILFNPFDAGDPVSDVSIAKSMEGTCAPSVVDRSNANAYRCFGKHRVLDPCFRNPLGSDLVCMDSPFSDTAVAFKAKRIPTSRADPDAPPWYLQMANGQLCAPLSGATGVLNGMRMNYRCDDGAFLYGDVDTSQPMWTIRYQAKDSRTVVSASIVSAWR